MVLLLPMMLLRRRQQQQQQQQQQHRRRHQQRPSCGAAILSLTSPRVLLPPSIWTWTSIWIWIWTWTSISVVSWTFSARGKLHQHLTRQLTLPLLRLLVSLSTEWLLPAVAVVEMGAPLLIHAGGDGQGVRVADGSVGREDSSADRLAGQTLQISLAGEA
jgi:hypothetical protein